ncbi:CACTA en-spm transposon protein [Cucumis melo var. makuwa]|uniref:CACTA en-spm transposon protein n=1 Tax=Cucumis melo var. makuwa TaxID=1194695 RepID=A0A5D3DYX8_CUCMM|nr:CACTA en-spm transposon protein [Cucumis melo var. makuwa]
MLNDLQGPIEHEEEIEEFRLEDEMLMNVGLMHVKVLNGWSNKSFDMLLELLRAAFPMCNSTIPSSFYEAKRKLRAWAWDTRLFTHASMTVYWPNEYLVQVEMKGYQACPMCKGDRSSFRIRGRISFMGHRRYFPQNHVWRRSMLHDRKVERKAPPVDKKRKRALNWTKKSIFFDLPYWSRLLLRDKLDVMHIEKNVCDNLVGTLLNIEGKTKDTTNARLDLQDLKIRKDLHLVEAGNRLVKPHVSYTLTTIERVEFSIMSYRRSNFMETDDMFLQSEDDLDNIAGGSSSVGNNTAGFSSQQVTLTPNRRAQSRLLELECHVAINGRILMTIAPEAEKPISPYVVCFSQAIGVCVRITFPVHCLKWADVGREYIEVVKGDLQRLFVLDFNDQAMNRFVEHQMLMTFKEFRADCHRHFKEYNDPEEARANPPNALVGRDEDWHFLCDHYISRAFQKQSRTNKAARQKQSYNHSSGSKSFLQRQYELAERKGEPADRVELFQETHVRAGTVVSQAAEDVHVLGRRLGYSKGLGWGPKAHRTASASSSSTSCLQSTEKEIELQAKLHEALERIEVQDRNHQALASQVESMKKMIEELTRAQQGPPHDP